MKNMKQCNVVMIATDKAKDKTFGQIGIHQHLYLTSSNDEIKEGDLVVVGGKFIRTVVKNDTKDSDKFIVVGTSNALLRNACKKIIASTDSSLNVPYMTNYGQQREVGNVKQVKALPLIPDSFIQAYVKANGAIETVNVEMEGQFGQYDSDTFWRVKTREDGTCIIHQSRMYSREEVKAKFLEFVKDCAIDDDLLCHYDGDYTDLDKWIEENL